MESMLSKRVSHYSVKDERRCAHYSVWPTTEIDSRHGLDALFWTLFLIEICFIILVGRLHMGIRRRVQQAENRQETNIAVIKKIRKSRKWRCLICWVLLTLSLPLLVVQVLALLAIQFCQGEDLISFYWSSWSVLQLASISGMSGIALNELLWLLEHELPPWNNAMASPVVVLLALTDVVQALWHLGLSWLYNRHKNSTPEDSLPNKVAAKPFDRHHSDAEATLYETDSLRETIRRLESRLDLFEENNGSVHPVIDVGIIRDQVQ